MRPVGNLLIAAIVVVWVRRNTEISIHQCLYELRGAVGPLFGGQSGGLPLIDAGRLMIVQL